MIYITPYESAAGLIFGSSEAIDCIELHGPAVSTWQREDAIDLYYDAFIARFERNGGVFKEITILPPTVAMLCGAIFRWNRDSLRDLIVIDNHPLLICGSIVFFRLGVMITGVLEDDLSQQGLTAFRRGALDSVVADAVPFEMGE